MKSVEVDAGNRGAARIEPGGKRHEDAPSGVTQPKAACGHGPQKRRVHVGMEAGRAMREGRRSRVLPCRSQDAEIAVSATPEISVAVLTGGRRLPEDAAPGP